tara:strand:- start:12 stop:365 length:354 start_codon:yes stop_codon:yes gene_type:complete
MAELDAKYRDAGLVVMAFPSTDFNQEYKTPDKVAEFAKKMGAEFPVMELISVNPPNEPDYWTWLKAASGETKDVSWNFSCKFVVAPDGKTVKRYNGDPNECEDDIVALLPGATKSGL